MISRWIARWQSQDKAQRLYDELSSRESSLPSIDEISTAVLRRMVQKLHNRYPPIQGLSAFEVIIKFYVSDDFKDGRLPPPPDTRDLVKLGRYQDAVTRRIRTHQNADVLEAFVDTLSGALATFLAHAPPHYLRDEAQFDAEGEGAYPGAFMTTLGDVMQTPGAAIQDLIYAFFSDEVIEAGLFAPLRKQLERNFQNADRRKPSEGRGSPLELAQLYLADTLFDGLFDLPIPFSLAEPVRLRHQWIIGGTGSGKTTLMSAMLLDDLQRVAAGQASVVLMDSQNELIPDIARLQLFAPGAPLHGKLIYLEPDPDHPLALNIFDMKPERLVGLSNRERMLLERGAIWMVEFFLSSLVKAEASAHQDTFLKYVIPALMAIPNATVFTFKELLEPAATKNGKPPGFEKYAKHFSGLRPDVQQWLSERLHSNELAPTRNAIRARLDGFTADPFFHDMFIHPRNRFDMFNELQSGKVILINTMKGLLKSGTEPFGRYFIARLLQAMEERMLLSRGDRLPVYAYIDEASDYIAEEENVEELIDKARKQNVALIFANQRANQITSPTVREALSRAAIQCHGQANPDGSKAWTMTIDRQPAMRISYPPVTFADFPPMSDTQYAAMMQQMHELYYKPADTPALPPPVAQTANDGDSPDIVQPAAAPPSAIRVDKDDGTAWG